MYPNVLYQDIILTSAEVFLMSRIDYIFCIIWIPPKTSSAHQALVKNRIHYPDSYKSTSPWLLDTPIPASCVFYPATSCCMSAAIAAMLLVLFHSVLRINLIAVLIYMTVYTLYHPQHYCCTIHSPLAQCCSKNTRSFRKWSLKVKVLFDHAPCTVHQLIILK